MIRQQSSARKRKILREILEGRHGFQYLCPAHIQIDEVLEGVAKSRQAKLVMLTGAPGVGITSTLERFSSMNNDQVIKVKPAIGARCFDLIGHLLQSAFPVSDLSLCSRNMYDALLAYSQVTSRRIIVIDDLEVMVDLNTLGDRVVDELRGLATGRGGFSAIISTRRASLLKRFSAIKSPSDIHVLVQDFLRPSEVSYVVEGFYKFCNARYGMGLTSKNSAHLTCTGIFESINKLVFAMETLYCLEAMGLPMPQKLNYFERASEFNNSPESLEAIREQLRNDVFI